MPSTSAAQISAATSTTGSAAVPDPEPSPVVDGVYEVWRALTDSPQMAEDFYMIDCWVLGEWAGALTDSPSAGSCSVLLRRSSDAWEIVAIGSDLVRDDLVAQGAPEDIADFLVPWPTLDTIRQRIVEHGSAAVDFDIAGYRLRGDWAALVISGPGTERVMVLAARGPEGWSVVDVGADLTQEYLYERGAPQDIVDFLCPT